MRLLLLMASLLAPAFFLAQSHQLSLAIQDLDKETPLPFVSVQLSPGGASGTTDEKGVLRFTLEPGRYTIRASFTGYADYERTITLNAKRSLTISMESTSATLETIVVTDQDARLDLSRPQMGVERLTASKLASIPSVLGERDVLRSLQLLPGVTSAGEASNGISVRGGSIDQNLLLLDGAPIFTPTHLFGLFTVFTPDAVGGIDLYRGNIPARFGGRVSSVIDVQSKIPNATSPVIKGGIGLVSSNLSIETPLGKSRKWNVLAAARGGFNDFAFNLIKRLRGTKSRFGDATIKLRYQPGENDMLTFSGFYSGDFYQVDLLSSLGGVAATSNQYAYLTLNGGLEWVRLLNDELSLSTQVTNAHFAPELRFPQLDGSLITFASGIGQQTIRTTLSGDESAKHAYTIGLQADRYTIVPGTLNPGASTNVLPILLSDERGMELSVFVEDEWHVNERLTIGAGLRYTSYRQLGPDEQRRYIAGAELSDRNLESVLETYYRQLTDLLEYKPGADFFLNPTVETDLLRGEGRAYGLELTASRRTGRITGEVNYAFARVENRVIGNNFNTRINRGEWYLGYFDQPHSFSANITLDEGKTHELGFNLVIQSHP